jgi:hypothetical protein
MFRRSAFFVALTLLSACEASEPSSAQDRASPRARLVVGAHVLIAADALVHDRAAEDDRRPMHLVGGTASSGRLAVVEADAGGLVEVRTIPRPDCPELASAASLRLFVDAEALTPAGAASPACPGVEAGVEAGPRERSWHFEAPEEPCEAWVLPAETSLRWPRGGEAGETTREQLLPSVSEGRGDQRCFPSEGLRLCAARSAFTHEPARACMGIADAITQLRTARYAAKVRLGMMKIEGELDDGFIATTAITHLDELSDCFAPALARSPSTRGRVAIDFEIDASGEVTSSRVVYARLDPPDPTVGPCMADVVLAWRFPLAPGSRGAKVRYPFVLRSRF